MIILPLINFIWSHTYIFYVFILLFFFALIYRLIKR